MFAVIVFAAVLVILFMPYIKRAVHRAGFIRSLRKICALKKYKIEIANPFYVYFRNFSKTYDVTVDTGRTLYALKLWNEYYRNANIIFSVTRKVMRRSKSPDVFGNGGKKTHATAERYLGRLPELCCVCRENRRILGFFLTDINRNSVWLFNGKEAVKLGSGDILYDMTLMTPMNFLDNIRGKTV